MSRHLVVFVLLTLASCGGGSSAPAPCPDAGKDSGVPVVPDGVEAAPDTPAFETGEETADAPRPDVIVEGGFGWPCKTNDDCDSGFCMR